MKRRTRIALAAGGVALAALLAWAFAPRPLQVETAQATTGPFETTIDEDARTRLAERYVVSTPLAGRLARITLKEGDAVEAGAVVATLAPSLSPLLDERTLREQQARLGAAEAALLRAGTRIGAAQVALERARIEEQRTGQLAAQGFVAPTQVDARRLDTLAARKELATAEEGEHVARHELAQARAALGALREGRGAPFELRAPVAGRVLKLHHTSETPLAPGAPVLEIGDTRRLEVVAELLTSDALAVPAGSEVRIERWGGPVALAGRVRFVEPAAFTKVSALGVEEQRVNVVIDLASPPAQWGALGDGFRVVVRIVTRSEAQALKVPLGALFPRADGQGSSVFLVESGRARLRPVTVVARNGAEAWIAQGLADGATVVIYPPPPLRDGDRVRVVRIGP